MKKFNINVETELTEKEIKLLKNTDWEEKQPFLSVDLLFDKTDEDVEFPLIKKGVIYKATIFCREYAYYLTNLGKQIIEQL